MKYQAMQNQTISKRPKIVPFIIKKSDGEQKLLSLSSNNYQQQFKRFLIQNQIDIAQAFQIKAAIEAEIKRLGSLDNISTSNTQKVSQSTAFPKQNKFNPDLKQQRLQDNQNNELSFDVNQKEVFDTNQKEDSFDRYSAAFPHAVTEPQRNQPAFYHEQLQSRPIRRQFVLLKNFKQTYSPKASVRKQYNNAVFQRLYENTTQNVRNRVNGDRNFHQQLQQRQYQQMMKFQKQRKKISSSPDFFKELYGKQTQSTKRKQHNFIDEKISQSSEEEAYIPPVKYLHSPKVNKSPKSGSKCEYREIIQQIEKSKIKQKLKQAQIRKQKAERKQALFKDRCQRHKQDTTSKQKVIKSPKNNKILSKSKIYRKPVQCITKLLQQTYQQFNKKSKFLT